MAAGTPKLKASRKWKVNEKGTTQATNVFQVICDDKDDGPNVAAAVCPDIGDEFDADHPQLLVVDVDASEGDQLASGVKYEVTVEYSTESDNPNGGGNDGSNHPDPTERPGILRLSYEDVEETLFRHLDAKPIVEDADGNAIDTTTTWSPKWDYSICNSDGKPFPEGIREPIAEAVYSFEKNITTLDWVRVSEVLDGYVNSVNQDTVAVTYRGATKVFKKETLLLKSPASTPGFENNIQFETVSFQLRYRRDGWRRKLVDQGLTRQLNNDPSPAHPASEPIRDAFGEPITSPALLNGRGMAVGSKPTPSPDKPAFLRFRMKDLKKFSKLPFPEFS
jgi:hypothetical protein